MQLFPQICWGNSVNRNGENSINGEGQKILMNRHKYWKITNVENRIEAFDFIRGALMILVILQHAGIWYGEFILAFHMPMFFALSGCLYEINFSGEKVNFGEYIKRKFSRLIVPYFFFELIGLVISYGVCVLNDSCIDLSKALWSVVLCINTEAYNGVMMRLWFLPCMFICDVYFYLLYKFVKKSIACNIIIMLIMFALSYLLSYSTIERFPFTVDIAIMGTAFILFGFLIHRIHRAISTNIGILWNGIIAILSIGIMIVCVKNNYSRLLMFNDVYGNYLMAICGAIVGSVAFFIVFKQCYEICLKLKFNFIKKYIVWIGQNTLEIFPMHLILLYFASILLAKLKMNKWPLRAIVVLIIMVPIVNLIIHGKSYFELKKDKPIKN